MEKFAVSPDGFRVIGISSEKTFCIYVFDESAENSGGDCHTLSSFFLPTLHSVEFGNSNEVIFGYTPIGY